MNSYILHLHRDILVSHYRKQISLVPCFSRETFRPQSMLATLNWRRSGGFAELIAMQKKHVKLRAPGLLRRRTSMFFYENEVRNAGTVFCRMPGDIFLV